jgi:hypothetical protein
VRSIIARRLAGAPALAALLLAAVLAGCAASAAPPAGRPRAAARGADSPVVGERLHRDRLLALRRFRPARPAVDSGGECVVREGFAPGERILAGYFPSRADGEVLVNLTVDSAGRLLRYEERRGLLRVPGMAQARTAAARDSAVRAAERATRTTHIWLDRVTGEARAVNQGGGEPSEGVFGRVDEFETARELGLPGARAARVAALCRA